MRKIFNIILLIVFFVISCDNGNMEQEDLLSGDNPFIGTWESIIEKEFDFDARLLFTENEISAHGKDIDGKYRITPDNIYDYTFSDNLLIATHKQNNFVLRCEYDFEISKIFEFSGTQYRKITKEQIIN